MFNMKTYELKFPLVHPNYVLPDIEYERNINKLLGQNQFANLSLKIEGKIRRIIIDLIFSISRIIYSRKKDKFNEKE